MHFFDMGLRKGGQPEVRKGLECHSVDNGTAVLDRDTKREARADGQLADGKDRAYQDYRWRYEAMFDLVRVGDSAEWVDWYADRRVEWESGGGVMGCETIDEWLRSPQHDPVVLVEDFNNQLRVESGSYRVGRAFATGEERISGLVGYRGR